MSAPVPETLPRRLPTWAWLVAGLVLAASVTVALLGREPLFALPFILTAGFTFTVLASVAPLPALQAVLIVCGVFSLPLGTEGIDLGIRVYYLDFVVAGLLLAAVAGTMVAPAGWDHRWPGRKAYFLLLGWLTISFVHGILAGNDPRNVLGDYRRMGLYSLTILVTAATLQHREHVARAMNALAFSGIGIAIIAAVRIATGTGYAEEMLAGSTIRYLSFIEASTAGIAVLIALSRILDPRTRSAGWWLLAVLGTVAVMVSNYRTAWAALLAGLAVQLIVMRGRRAIRTVALVALVMVPLLYLLIVATPLGALVLQRFNPENITTSGLWRLFSWRNAFITWLDHPLLGTGLGFVNAFEFFNIEVAEFAASFTSSIHNDPLWFLVNNGLIGVAAALPFTILWFRRAAAAIRDEASRPIVATSLGCLTIMGVTACLQPYFSTAGTVLIAATLLTAVLRADRPAPA